MCLAIPGKLLTVTDENGLRMGRVDYAGAIKSACLEYVPEAVVGQYVLVHAGFAISVIDEEEAHKTLALWRELTREQEREGPRPCDTPRADGNTSPGAEESA